MSKKWTIGDWAAEAERAEEEEKALAAAAATSAPPDTFPPLSESVATKSRKKKQQQTFTISEFTFGKSVSHGSRTRAFSDSRGLTTQEMIILPTGPRHRSGEEDYHGGLGRAFLDYCGGGNYREGPDRFDREWDHASGYGGGYERDRDMTGFLRDRERDEPSCADGSHDWSSLKRPFLPQGGAYDGERRGLHEGERRGFRQVNADLPPLRADEVENWGLAKKSLPLALDARPTRRDEVSRQQLRADEVDNWASTKKALVPAVVEIMHVQSRADEVATWLSSKKVPADESLRSQEMNAGVPSNWGRSMQQQAPENLQGRPVILASQRHHRSSSPPPGHMNADVSNALPPPGPKPKSNPFGSARPREEVLANRGLHVPRVGTELGAKERDSRPSSSHSSRPHTPEVSVEPLVKARPKVNPFGNAKPREVVLQEKGKDWRKIDFELEHRGVDRSETAEEMALKEEIRILTELSKQEVESKAQRMNGDHVKLHPILEELHAKEKELQRLIMMLDDNVRYSQKIAERPASRSGHSDIGRSSEFSERSGSWAGSRPGSRSGRSDTGSSHDPSEKLGSLPARRNLDASDRMHSLSGYGGGRGAEFGERPWSRFGQVDGTRNQEALERTGSWSRHNENSQFESLQRPRWQTAAALPTEVGGGAEYSSQASGPDIWLRANEGRGGRHMNWREQERINERIRVRKI